MRFSDWVRRPRNLMAVLLAVLLLPGATLVALGIRLLEQDRLLIERRARERAENASLQAIRVLEQRVALVKSWLHDPPAAPVASLPPDSVIVATNEGRLAAYPPERLAWWPATLQLPEAPASVFSDADATELERRDLAGAERLLRRTAGGANPAARAGALVRLARVLRKQGRTEEALATLGVLAEIADASVNGEPADLLGARARCALLAQLGRREELGAAARRLAEALSTGRWKLDAPTYEHVRSLLNGWLQHDVGAKPQQAWLSAALAGWWQDRSPQARSVQVDGLSLTVIGDRDLAFLAGPETRGQSWSSPAGVQLIGEGERELTSGVAGAIVKRASETGLPWTVVVPVPSSPGDELAGRRNILLAALAANLLFLAAAVYVLWRAVRREQEVAQTQSDFVAAVSHEFRTPLTTLRQFTEILMEDDNVGPDTRLGFYSAQARATDRLNRLVESLLDFGRMEAGRRPYRMASMGLQEWLGAVVEDFREDPCAAGFEVRFHGSANGVLVRADAEALGRAVWNLLENATKYTDPPGPVEVHARCGVAEVEISVRDHGPGIDPAELPHLFEKFYRGARARRDGVRGTGLGLAMVRHIVEAHGGRANAESNEGAGSTFRILLPWREGNDPHPDR